jgi:hypothetical protein
MSNVFSILTEPHDAANFSRPVAFRDFLAGTLSAADTVTATLGLLRRALEPVSKVVVDNR